jgi:RES domain-containing protein
VALEDMACAWMNDISESRKPAFWGVHARFGKSAAGILVPSFAHGAADGNTNLVLWNWGAGLPCRVTVYDSEQRLLEG